MEQKTPPTTTEGWRQLAALCRAAIGSLHCKLQPREKRVIEQIICFSYDWGRDKAMFGSGKMLAKLAGDMDTGDVSNAIGTLTRTGIVKESKAAPLHRLRKPMLYCLVPDALVALARPPQLTPEANRARNLIAAWHAAANEAYPLQCEYLPPDPDVFGDAMAELSRASVLADEAQNEQPKPGASRAGEPGFSEGSSLPGPASASQERSDEVTQAKTLTQQIRESLYGPGGPGVIGESPITKSGESDPNWRISNYPRGRASDVPDVSTDGDINIPSGKHPDGDAGVIGDSPISQAEPKVKYIFVPVKAEGDAGWVPPTRASELFDELLACMGRNNMANYGSEWMKLCHLFPADVANTIAKWKQAKDHPKHVPWGGGNWRNEFYRQKSRREWSKRATEEVAAR